MPKMVPPALRRSAVAAAPLGAIWFAGLVWFATVPSADDSTEPADAIVVLTGGSQRLNSGIALLRKGKGRKLFVSGVNQQVGLEDLLRSSGAQDWAYCCVVLGHRAVDTLGNAGETAEWMRQQGFHSLRLVTAWYHMRRSLLEFERAMPEIEIVPHPVFPDQAAHEYWWARRETAALLVTEYGKYLASLARPLIEGLVPAGQAEIRK